MKELVQTNHGGEIATDHPKKKKVAGTLWKAMWMLKNTMLNDTVIMHERHQLRNDHAKTKMDKLSDELTDVIAQTKVLREEDKSIQERINAAMAEAKAAEVRIIACKEKLSEANVEERDAEQTANRKKARIEKTSHLCKTQLQHVEDEIALGKYVLNVIEHTVTKLLDGGETGAAAATGAATGSA
jgi:chromosome segregation ATPase